jgi:hypothetical protein
MKSLSIFKRIAQLWQGHGSRSESENDLSYEDALLDWKLRRFMQSEYGHAEPPQGVFGRVLVAIKAGSSSVSSTGAKFRSSLTVLATRIYKTLAMPTATSRILPGIVAFGLIVMVLSTNTHNVVTNPSLHAYPNIDFSDITARTTSNHIISSEQAQQEEREQFTVRGNVPEGLSQFYPAADLAFYHQVERHMPTLKKHITGNEQSQDIGNDYLITIRNEGF